MWFATIRINKKILILFLLYSFQVFGQACPSGFVAVEYSDFVPATGGACASGYVAHKVSDICSSDSSGVCWLVRQLCGAGITYLKTSNGVSVPLYAEKSGSPSICIKYNNIVCFADLEQGSASGAIHIKYNDTVYHTVQ